MIRRPAIPIVGFALLWALACPAFGAVFVRTQLDRDTIMAGETATLTVTVEGGTPKSIENFPPASGLSVNYRGTSQSTTIVNGNATFRHILNFTVQAAQPGEYLIPSVRVTVDSAQYPTEPLRLTVTRNDVNAANRYAFLKLNVPKQEIFVGEIMPVEVQLYVTEAESYQPPQLKSDGFVIHKQAEATRAQTQIGNMIYNVLTFRMSVSAAKAGPLTLGPAEGSLVLRLRGQADPNDFFGFARFQRRPVNLASEAAPVQVLPLPSADAPPDFSGAIGNFTWSVTAGPASVSAGDPITLKIVVSGRGNLDNLKLPELNWPDFKVYAPNAVVAPQDPLGLSGTKTFEQVIAPQSATVREIPELSLAYFDPGQKKYVRLTHGAMPLTVRPSAGGQAIPTVLAGKNTDPDEPRQRTDIVHIKTDPGVLAAAAPPLALRPWFWFLQALPVAGFLAASLWRARQDRLANNPRLRRRIEVSKMVSSGVAELRQLAQANQADPFFALVFRLLQEQLGERLDLPGSAITEAVLDEHLPRRGAPPELIERLHALFQLCNQARYAPVQTNEALQAVASNLEKALGDLQQLAD